MLEGVPRRIKNTTFAWLAGKMDEQVKYELASAGLLPGLRIEKVMRIPGK
jgi:hypothetical protein